MNVPGRQSVITAVRQHIRLGRPLPLVIVGVAAVYFLAGRLGLYFAFVHASASPVWPPTGIALAALLLLGLRVWPAIFVGAFLVNFTTSGWPLTSLGIAGGNTLEAVVGAYLVNRFANGPLAFQRSHDIFKFAALAALLSTSVSATIGVASLALGGHAAWAKYTTIWLTWWLGDAVGTLVVAPLLLLWRQREDFRILRRRPGEAALLALAILLTGWAVFGNLAPVGLRNGPVAFMCIPTLLWAVFRFGPPETATVIVALSALAVSGTLRGHGPFVGGTTNESLLFLQAFIGTMVVTLMPIAALVREGRRAGESLRESEERSRVAIEAGEMRTWDWTVATGAVRWSPSLERIHGLASGTFPGTLEAVFEQAHPDDRETLRRAAEQSLEGHGRYALEYRIVRRDGVVRWVEARGRVLRDRSGRTERIIGVCTDVTERRHRDQERAALLAEEQGARQRAEQAERRLAVLGEIADSITASLDLDTVLRRIAEGAKDVCHGDTAALFLRDGESQTMIPRYQIGAPAGYPSLRIEPGQGLGGHVMMTGRPRRTANYLEDPQVPSDFHAVARQAGTTALMVVPITIQQRVEGLLYISNAVSRAFTDEDEVVCLRLADQAAIAIQNATLFARERGLRAEAQRAERRAAFLAESSRILASSLDSTETLRTVARLAVPTFADWCLVDFVTTDQVVERVVERVAVAAADPAIEQTLARIRRYAPDRSSPQPAARALRSGEAVVFFEVSEETLTSTARDSDHLALLRELKPRSAIAVPMRARHRTIGAITFVRITTTGDVYEQEDVTVAKELAERAALAVDNAALYGEAAQARGQADAANRAKDEFLTILSHELRTPLNAVYGWARMLGTGQLDAETTRRAIDAIMRNAHSQSRLIDDLLDVARIVAGKMRLEVRSVDLPAVLGAALDAVRPAAEAKDILLQTALDPAAGPVQGDSDRLQQIAWNLLMNAVKFTPKGGRIQIVLQRVTSGVEIVVSDTGLGIRREVLPHIFERFRQGDMASTRSQTGLGIGLALVRHLTELHGGTVSAESAGEGQGATFRVRLPLAAVASLDPTGEPYPTARAPLPPYTGPSLQGLRVLVVDDDTDALTLVSMMLTAAGTEVRTCASASEALSLFRSWRPDLLISDIEMPGEDGHALIRKVRALGPADGGQTPAIALTAYGRPEDRASSISAGYDRHIVKPVDPSELGVVINTLASQSLHTRAREG